MYIKFKKSGGNQEIKEAGLFCEGWTVESWVGIVNKYPPPPHLVPSFFIDYALRCVTDKTEGKRPDDETGLDISCVNQ